MPRNFGLKPRSSKPFDWDDDWGDDGALAAWSIMIVVALIIVGVLVFG